MSVSVCSSSVTMKDEALSSLFTPALVVDLDKVKRNVQKMTEHYEKMGVQLRPHMKTHKTLYEHTHIRIRMHGCINTVVILCKGSLWLCLVSVLT